MSIEIRAVDEGFGDDDAPLVQIDVRYTGVAHAALHESVVDPLLVVQMQRETAVVDSTLQDIAARSRAGEGTPVLVSHVDALGLRTRLEELALARFPGGG
jgi:hypothetical protein